MKIRPVGAELFHADAETDMTKITVALRSFANAPKNGYKRARSKGDNSGRENIGVLVSRYQHITKTGTRSL
jgi:hypothetical protein